MTSGQVGGWRGGGRRRIFFFLRVTHRKKRGKQVNWLHTFVLGNPTGWLKRKPNPPSCCSLPSDGRHSGETPTTGQQKRTELVFLKNQTRKLLFQMQPRVKKYFHLEPFPFPSGSIAWMFCKMSFRFLLWWLTFFSFSFLGEANQRGYRAYLFFCFCLIGFLMKS